MNMTEAWQLLQPSSNKLLFQNQHRYETEDLQFFFKSTNKYRWDRYLPNMKSPYALLLLTVSDIQYALFLSCVCLEHFEYCFIGHFIKQISS